jgi:hypothetical protein
MGWTFTHAPDRFEAEAAELAAEPPAGLVPGPAAVPTAVSRAGAGFRGPGRAARRRSGQPDQHGLYQRLGYLPVRDHASISFAGPLS